MAPPSPHFLPFNFRPIFYLADVIYEGHMKNMAGRVKCPQCILHMSTSRKLFFLPVLVKGNAQEIRPRDPCHGNLTSYSVVECNVSI